MAAGKVVSKHQVKVKPASEAAKQKKRKRSVNRKQCWPLTPAAIMRPAIMECVIG